MRRSFIHFAVAAALPCAVAALCVTPASAGGIGYLSRVTSGSCTEGSPCSSMTSALNVAGVGGKVVCLDKGNYGATSITQSVTISCGDGLWEARGTTTINIQAGADVAIEGLKISDNGGSNGISFTGQGTLHLHRVWIGNGPTGFSNNSHAVNFTPSGPATLFVTDSVFYNNGSGSSVSAGVYIKPASGVTANVSIERSSFEANNFGIVADGTSGGSIRGTVKDSFVTGNRNNGITATTTSSHVVLTVDNTLVTGNAFGLVAGGGANAGMLVSRSTINGNTTGLYTNNGAAIYTYRDNRLNGNFAGDGAFTGAVNLQ